MIHKEELSLANLDESVAELKRFLSLAAENGEDIDKLERGLFDRLLTIGFIGVQLHIQEQGPGDVGETLVLPDGKEVRRQEELHERRYVSIFGEHKFARQVYGTRPTQKIEAAPLDARLNLPESEFSYVLQEWDQSFCVQNPFGQSSRSVERILKLQQSVGSLERMNVAMASAVEPFRVEQATPPPEEEASIMVAAADGKGVPMRREEGDARPTDPKHPKKGEKKNKKRMACVGAAYTIEPFVRNADQIVNELLHQEAEKRRPKPHHKRVRADLTQQVDGEEVNGKDIVFGWLAEEIATRNPDGAKPTVFLSDGEHALEDKAHELLAANLILILDLYHPLEKLWEVAHCFHAEGTDEARAFVEKRLRMFLNGEVEYVVRGLRQMKTKHGLHGNKAKIVKEVTQYYHNNRHRMKYDEYLAAGYPIGSGAVEGACRNLVKDRMEGSGMRWRPEGAQAMLSLRATFLNGDWERFSEFRIEQETERLYPYRRQLENALWN